MTSNPETDSPTTTTTTSAATTTAASDTPPPPPLELCTNCGSFKRRSTSHQQPSPKKPATAATHHDFDLSAFTRLPLPVTSPILRRCVSDPLTQPGSANPNPNSSGSSPVSLNPSQSPGTCNSPARLPPLHPKLRRAYSDVTSASADRNLVAAAITPPRPTPPAKRKVSLSPSPSDSAQENSPNSRKLKKMKKMVREMGQWCKELMRQSGEEEEEEEAEAEDGSVDNNNGNRKGETEIVDEDGELVSVDRTEESMIIHFRCPCGKGYEILFSGTDCYYMLT